MDRRSVLICASVLASLAAPVSARPQAAESARRGRTAEAVRLSGERVELDGQLREAVWSKAPLADGFVQFRPAAGSVATQPTEVRVAYDDHAIYVAVRNRDSRPDSIVARLARRDQNVQSDWFTVLIDSYDDRRTAFGFSVNPVGVKRDFTIVDDEREDATWDAVWDVATGRDAEGWTAEYRIPLSQLRFNGGDRALVWGVNFSRLIARTDELSYWSTVLPVVPGLVSQFGELRGLSSLASPRGLEIQPYTLARTTRAPGDAANPFYQSTAVSTSAGADLRYGLGAGVTLSATINPDFGQIEADPSQVNLTANEVRLTERRPFFVEGTDVFNVTFPQLFYSRRIGAPPRGRVRGGAAFADVPERTTILGAAKLTGKTRSGWSIGVLDAVTAQERGDWVDTLGRVGATPVEPLTNFFAARAVRDFNRGTSALGAIVTSVARGSQSDLSTPRASTAQVGGVDGRHRLAKNYELSAAAFGSRLAGSPAAVAAVQRNSTHRFDRPDAGHLEFDSSRTTLDGYLARAWLSKVGGGSWRWQVGTYAMSPAFDVNDIGFVPEADRVRQWVDASYRSLQPNRVFRRYIVQLGQAAAWSYGRERTDMNGQVATQMQFHNHAGVSANVWRWGSALNTNILRGGGGLLEQGGRSATITLDSDARRSTRGSVAVNGWSKDEQAGSGLSLGSRLSVRPTTQMELSIAGTLTTEREAAQYIGGYRSASATEFLVGELRQVTTSSTVRADYTFSPRLSLELYAQPFISAGRYSTFRTLADGRAEHFDERYHRLKPAEVSARDDEGKRTVTLEQDPSRTFSFGNPDFNIKQFNSTAVLRWEYRPGSTLFVVWGQRRDHFAADGDYRAHRNAADLFGAPATNVLTVKASYWFGL